MENLEPQPVSIGLTIRHPQKLLGGIWLGAGALLLLAFFLPNFEMAGMDVSGPKIIEMVWRRDSVASRIFDDAGFFMMVAVPIAYLFIGLGSMALGLIMVLRERQNAALGVAIASFMGFIFTVIGAVVLENSSSDVPFFAKLFPKPTFVYWLAMALQFILCVVSVLFLVLRRRSAGLGEKA